MPAFFVKPAQKRPYIQNRKQLYTIKVPLLCKHTQRIGQENRQQSLTICKPIHISRIICNFYCMFTSWIIGPFSSKKTICTINFIMHLAPFVSYVYLLTCFLNFQTLFCANYPHFNNILIILNIIKKILKNSLHFVNKLCIM